MGVPPARGRINSGRWPVAGGGKKVVWVVGGRRNIESHLLGRRGEARPRDHRGLVHKRIGVIMIDTVTFH